MRSALVCFFAVFITALESGCQSTVAVKVPAQRFLTPETQGELWSGRATMSYGSRANIILADDLGRASPNVDKPKVRKDDGGSLGVELGMLARLDLFYATEKGLGAKYQIVGNPRKEAKAGNFSLAASLSGNQRTYSETAEKTYDLTGKRIKIDSNSSVSYMDYGILAGYRQSDINLFYLSLGYSPFSASGSFKREIEGRAIEEYDLETHAGRVQKLLAGYQLSSDRFSFLLETGMTQTEFDRAQDQTRWVLGGQVAYSW